MDEWEEETLAMLADLVERGEVPESLKLMNEVALRSIMDGALRPGPFFDALFPSDEA